MEKRKRSTKRRKSNPVLTKENTPVINALRDAMPGTKIWICKDDTLEVNRKPLDSFVATPGAGVSVDEHVKVLLSAIGKMTESSEDATEVIEAIFEDEDPHFVYPNMTDRDIYRGVKDFDMPNGLEPRICKMYGVRKTVAAVWIEEYKKYMYIRAIYPSVGPSKNIGRVQRLHLQYTKSYGDLCGILENRIAYEPLDRFNAQVQHTEYRRTEDKYYYEFSIIPCKIAWNGPEVADIDRMVDLSKYFILKKFWRK